MLSTKESSLKSTTSKHIETILPYGKHNKGVDVTKTKEDVMYNPSFLYSPNPTLIHIITTYRFFWSLSITFVQILVKMYVLKWSRPLIYGYKFPRMI